MTKVPPPAIALATPLATTLRPTAATELTMRSTHSAANRHGRKGVDACPVTATAANQPPLLFRPRAGAASITEAAVAATAAAACCSWCRQWPYQPPPADIQLLLLLLPKSSHAATSHAHRLLLMPTKHGSTSSCSQCAASHPTAAALGSTNSVNTLTTPLAAKPRPT